MLNTVRLSTRPIETMRRYVDSRGDYPWTLVVRTPVGRVPLTLTHPHDVRTVNEVFFRRDYGTGRPAVVVDIGANIGISAAYFLSRSPDSRVYCWEPVPQNLAALERNTARFGRRVVVSPNAVAPVAGRPTSGSRTSAATAGSRSTTSTTSRRRPAASGATRWPTRSPA